MSVGWCVKCEQRDMEMIDVEKVDVKNKPSLKRLKGKCKVCGTNMSVMVKTNG